MKRIAQLLAIAFLCLVPLAVGNVDQAHAGNPERGLTAQADGGANAIAHFHAKITADRDVYTSGETARVTVRYTIDPGAVSPGDYVMVSIPADIASKSSFSVSKQHFSSVEDLGGGQYKLVFGPDAATALSGSMGIRVTTSADEVVSDDITIGDAAKTITVAPASQGAEGTGTFADEAIMKDGLGNEGMDYGGYDYSGSEPAQIGLFDSSVDNDFTYRIFVNRKNVHMTGVTVSDTLPDGMYFIGSADSVTCRKIDPQTISTTDEPAQAEVTIAGQTLTVDLGDIDQPVEISYRVHVPAQNSVQLRNHSEVVYTQDGELHKENRDYIAQSNDFSAANGVKSVDRTIISDDPADQWVTYTIRFWNDKGFATGEIDLADALDEHIKFLYADDNDLFSVVQDSTNPQILHIANSKPVPTSTEALVTFVCDFSAVPVGYTVENTVGGNVTRTTKVAGSLELEAAKTVDGEAPKPDEAFTFQLLDQDRNVLQTAQNDEGGTITFDKLTYGQDDLGATYTYYVCEKAGEDSAYEYDATEYTVTAQVADEASEDGTIATSVSVAANGASCDAIVFDNKRIPDKPDEPDKPDQPDKPDEPGKPDQPDKPDEPDEPDQPDEPNKPGEPDEPEEPDQPDKPNEPDQPNKPSTTQDTTEKAQPTKTALPATGDPLLGVVATSAAALVIACVAMHLTRRRNS